MNRRYTVILNEAAGGGKAEQRASVVLPLLRDSGLELDVKPTRSAGHATELARAAFREGSRAFIAVGGDGTMYEVLNGVFPEALEDRVTLASLPLGTGNSFLRDFGIDTERKAVERILRGETRGVDVVRAEHADGVIFYINLLSVGFSAAVGALMNRRYKPFGAAGYPLAVVTSLLGLSAPEFELCCDDASASRERAVLLSFSNSQYTGGTMRMAPPANVSDGRVDIVRVAPMSRVELLRTFPKIYDGTHLSHAKVTHRTATRVVFPTPRREAVMVDGEVVDLALRSLEVLPCAVDVVA
jgi:diacylglycerol kinase (ATP)